MTATTKYPSVVVVGQYSVTDTEIDCCQLTGLDRGLPAYVIVRRWVDGTGCIRERLRVLYGRGGVQALARKHASKPAVLRKMGIFQALRLIEERAGKADEETPPAGEPGGQPTPGDPVTAGPANGQSDAGGEGQPSSPGPPSAEFAYQETDPGGTQLTDGERRARARQFVGEVGRYITSEQPEGMPVDEWYRKVLQELRCTDWDEVLLDPRVRRGQWGHVWEAMDRAKVKVAGPVAP